MAREDERSDDRGRPARKFGVTQVLQLVFLVLAVAAIVWRGGQMTEKLDTVHSAVGAVQADVQAINTAVINTRIQVHELQTRANSIDKELTTHETRITRIETRPGR